MEFNFLVKMDTKHTIVILDTNFLYLPFEFRVDIYEELDRLLRDYKLIIFDKTLDEVNNMAVLGLTNKKIFIGKIKVEETHIDYIDDAIVDYAKRNHEKYNLVVATQDKELKKRLEPYKVSIVVLKNKSYLDFERKASVDL